MLRKKAAPYRPNIVVGIVGTYSPTGGYDDLEFNAVVTACYVDGEVVDSFPYDAYDRREVGCTRPQKFTVDVMSRGVLHERVPYHQNGERHWSKPVIDSITWR